MSRRRKNDTGIPDYIIDSLARAILPVIQNYFATEEGQRTFEEWKTQRNSQLNRQLNKNNPFKV